MPRNIPVSFRQTAEASYNEDVDLCFVTITHPTLSEAIRVVWDTKDFILNGNVYVGFPFDITILSDDDQPPKAQLTIQNVDRLIGEAIQNLRSPPRIRIELASTKDFFTRTGTRRAYRGIFYTGFETGDLSEADGNSGTLTVVTDPDHVKSGDFALKFPTQAGSAYLDSPHGFSLTDAVVGFYVYLGGLPTEEIQIAGFYSADTDNNLSRIIIREDGRIGLTWIGGPGSQYDENRPPLKLGRWYHVEHRLVVDGGADTEGRVELWVNTEQYFFADDLDTNAGGPATHSFFAPGDLATFTNGIGFDIWFDDWYMYDLQANIFYTGFETGDKSDLGGTSRDVSIVDTDFVPNGTYALKFSSIIGEALGSLTGGSASITNPTDATGSVEVKVGDLIVAVIGQQTALTATGVTDNLGNTYTAQNAGTDAGNTTGRMFYAYVTVPGTLTTVHFAATASANDVSVCAAAFRGPFNTSPLDKTAANRSNDTSNPLTANSIATPSFPRTLQIGWFAGANSASGIDTTGAAGDIVAQQFQSTAIQSAISAAIITDGSAQTMGFTAAGTIGNNVIGTASFKGSDPNPYVESTTGFDIEEAILRFKVGWGGVFVDDDITYLGGFANSSDDTLIAIMSHPELGIGFYIPATDTYYFSQDNNLFTGERTHLVELKFVPDAGGSGSAKLWLNGDLVVSESNLTTGAGNIDRAFLETSLSGEGIQFIYDEFTVLNTDELSPDIIYSADNLYLQNAKVDALQITADIVGWDYLQRVWPSARADKVFFPGLFR